jgi:hypothetical protein
VYFAAVYFAAVNFAAVYFAAAAAILCMFISELLQVISK